MKCHDCKKEVGYSKLYCPHCSAELFHGKEKLSSSTWSVYTSVGLNAAMKKTSAAFFFCGSF